MDHAHPLRPIVHRPSLQRLRRYLGLTKPGIILGNGIAALGGFLLAARGEIDPAYLVLTLLGIGLVVASGCVLNNVIDRDIDRLMVRTRQRAMARGEIAPGSAFLYALVLGTTGLGLLIAQTNTLTFLVVLAGLIVYVGPYSLRTKRQSVHGTLVGSLAGATPALAGYTAVHGQIDAGAVLLFLMFCLWQVPHSYAIAMHRSTDFRTAGIPLAPLRLGASAARRQIFAYVAAFTAVAASMTFTGYTGAGYLLVVGAIGAYWLLLAAQGFDPEDETGLRTWARRQFAFSVLAISLVSLMLAIDYVPRAHFG